MSAITVRWLSITQTAQTLNIGRRSIEKLIRQGIFEVFRPGAAFGSESKNTKIMISKDSIDKYVEKSRLKTTKVPHVA